MIKNYTLGIFALSLLTASTLNAQVGINTTEPDPSSALDIVSDSKGVLVPRLTLAQRDHIPTPANGLLVYQTDSTPGFYYYNGTAWQQLAGGSGAYVDLTTDQSIGGKKTFTSDIMVSGHTFGAGGGTQLSNMASGTRALFANTTGNANTAAGYFSLAANTTGYANTAAGYYALSQNIAGTYNTAHGYFALGSNTSGERNAATGGFALYNNTAGSTNTANGMLALYQNTTGTQNTAIGSTSLQNNSIGSNNTAVGNQTLHANKSGNQNAAHGSYALERNTTGSNNIAIGVVALYNNITGSGNTGVGMSADVALGNLSNATAIGYNAVVDASNKVQIGNGAVTAVKLGGTGALLETSRIKLTGGNAGANKVLTSDADGLATWQTPASGVVSRKRSIILDLASLDATAALSVLPGTKKVIGGWQRPILMLPEGSITQFQTQIPTPSDWNGSSPFVVIVLYSSPASTGNFKTSLKFHSIGLGGGVTNGSGSTPLVVPESALSDGLMEAKFTSTVQADSKLIHFNFRRSASAGDLDDSSTGEMHIHGVRIEYFD